MVQRWKTESKATQISPLQHSAACGCHCFWQFTLTTNLAVQGLDEELVPGSSVTSGALEDQSC